MSSPAVFAASIFWLILLKNVVAYDYGLALSKTLLFYEAQRSGKLPPNQRVQWRGNSALIDGHSKNVDLSGGYYDAGDHVKFGFPMAFTVTMLASSVVEFGYKLKQRKELSNAVEAIKWGTDYFIKAHPHPNLLYGQVGDGGSDHDCWERAEDMSTPRTPYHIDQSHPGSDLAGETAAALAAASIAFTASNRRYSSQLLLHAKQLFAFADKYRGQYHNSISVAGQFYSSSGFQDELLWAAIWLYKATNNEKYLYYINESTDNGGIRQTFSWDDKYVGVQVSIAKYLLAGKFTKYINSFVQYKNNAEQFICNCINKGSNNIKRSPGGLLWFTDSYNLQYVTSASFVITTYAKTLTTTNNTLQCPGGVVSPQHLLAFVKSQVDYILGSNPEKTSYMVGFGSKFPQQVHHRGASILSIKKNRSAVTCKEGFSDWFNKNAQNPNVIDGAIVGGPNSQDSFTDSRGNYAQNEPATYNTAPLVGVLAFLA